MKPFFKLILQYYLKYIAKIVLFLHRPTIIAIAGSTNKAFVRNEIRKKLKDLGKNVWANDKSFNTEIGLPLAVLKLPSGYNSYSDWLPIIWRALTSVFKTDFPDILVLEMGVSRNNDMKYLLSIITPKISIITDITQRYLEGFSGMDDLVGEYELLVKSTPKEGLVILNWDNNRVRKLKKFSRAKIATFGQNSEAGWHIEEVVKLKKGERIVLKNSKETTTFEINFFGQHNVYAGVVSMIINDYFLKKHA